MKIISLNMAKNCCRSLVDTVEEARSRKSRRLMALVCIQIGSCRGERLYMRTWESCVATVVILHADVARESL